LNRRRFLPFICVIFLVSVGLSIPVLAEDTLLSSQAWQYHTTMPTTPDDTDHYAWVWQGGGDINDIFMIDSDYGWAAGSNLLLSTTNGGATWHARDAEVGTDREYYDIHFVDRQTGWLVGKHKFRDVYWNQAMIMHTADGGDTWQAQLSGENFIGPLEKVQFIDANIGWAADYGGHFLRTTNGGTNWTVVDTTFAGPFFFLDANSGWMSSGNDVYHTTDGGVNWSVQDTLTSSGFNAIWFTDASHGWMAGRELVSPDTFEGIIFATTDGGTNWTEQYSSGNPTGDAGLFDIVFEDTSSGWTVGSRGIILSTTDSGSSWAPLESDVLAELRSTQTAGGTVWAAGEGTMISSQDGGANWDEQGSSWPELHGVEALDENRAWIVGDQGTVLRTTNAGRTWVQQRDIPGPKLEWFSVSFSGLGSGYAVGEGGNSIVTADSGHSWSFYHTGMVSDLHGVHFPVSIEGWAVGDRGAIMHTTDGGQNWTDQATLIRDDFQAVHFVDALEGWIVGVDPVADMQGMHDGVLLQTTNGGQTWSNLGNQGMWDVDFVGSATGWTVESNFNISTSWHRSFIHRTTDGGSNWVKIPNTLPEGFKRYLRAVDFTSSDNGWLGGHGLLRTDTGGAQWLPKLEMTGAGITDLAMVGPDEGWAVGEDGLILHRETTFSPVTGLTISASGNDAVLHWTDTGATSYKIYRATNDPFFTPDDGVNLIATITDNTYPDTGALGTSAGNHTYQVYGVDNYAPPAASTLRVGEFDYDLSAGDP